MRQWMLRAAVVAVGLCLGLVVLEAVLQVAAYAVRPSAERTGHGARRVLAVGDSNVFGLYLPRTESYPAQLSELLPGATVVNGGIPGTTSGRLRALLPDYLTAHHPHDVLVTVGANDFWAGGHDRIERPWWLKLRLVRLGYLLAWYLRSDTPGVDPERPQTFVVGDALVDATTQRRPVFDTPVETVPNLIAIVDAIRASGARPWLVTYASDESVYRVASARLREAAAATGAPLVEVSAPRNEQFPDGHPTAAGYARVAAAVAQRLQARHEPGLSAAASSSSSRRQ